MRKSLILILFCITCVCTHAETLLLRTGARVKGTVVFQNEEVVVLRDAEGARFQYPRADIEAVVDDEAPEAKQEEQKNEDGDIQTTKKATILLELAGGAAFVPSQAGGSVSADLLVGSHHIGARHIFAGAGIGYHGVFVAGEQYNFLPVQAALRMPFTEQKHAPVFGLSLGYGIALSKNYTGGIYAGLDVGYRCQLNERTALALVAFAHFQQASVSTVTVIEDIEYTQKSGRNIVTSGLKFALYF